MKFLLIFILFYTFSKCYSTTQELRDVNVEYYTLQPETIGKVAEVTAKACKSCNCGKPNRSHRIVGGWMTEINEYPWMAALTLNSRFFCGGTLISDKYVLTAAHCFYKYRNDLSQMKKIIKVILGEHNMVEQNETRKEIYNITNVVMHKGFSPRTYDNDIALLKLQKKVTFRTAIQTACLPPPDNNFTGRLATVAGWGTISEGGEPSIYLRETVVPVLSTRMCVRRGYRPWRITDNMICAGNYRGHDSCQGDSGGALLVTNSLKQMLVIGIVSWGEGCARPNKPGVYTRVNRYLDWISNVTEDSCYCL